MRRWASVTSVALLAACGSGEASVVLVWPNDAARTATKQLAVYAFFRDVVGVSVIDIRCSELLGRFGRGEQIPGDPIDNPYEPSSEDKRILGFPKGDPVIYVVGFDGLEDDKHPIVEGCTEEFDTGGNSDDVEIEMRVIVPDEVNLVKVAGDRQVGHPGTTLAVPVTVKLQASLPGGRGTQYALPGVELKFEPSAELRLAGGTAGGSATIVTDTEGLAAAAVTMPGSSGMYEVDVDNELLDTLDSVEFQVSAIEAVEFRSTQTVSLGGAISYGVDIGFGNVVGSPAQDIVVLGCGSDVEHCQPGQVMMDPPGAGQLLVLDDALASPPQVSPVNGLDLGHAAVSLEIGEFVPRATGHEDVAILNGRRVLGPGDIRDASEIRVFSGGASGLRVTGGGRYTLTGSNAVSLAQYTARSGDRYPSLLAVSQGLRVVNPRKCRREPKCLPADLPDCGLEGEQCGCEPDEVCECPRGMSCFDTNTPGICVPDDRKIDRFENQYNSGRGFINAGGCHRPVLHCMKPENTQSSTCRCEDTFRNNECTDRDTCNCKVPVRILIGVPGSAHFPYDLAVGPLTGQAKSDIVVAVDGGVDFIESVGAGAWVYRNLPVMNNKAHSVDIADVDGDAVHDVLWFSKGPCHEYGGTANPCPIVLAAGQSVGKEGEAGCLGVVLRSGITSVDGKKEDGCRRFPLDFVPEDMCVGDFNGDSGVDVALSSAATGYLSVFLGDGEGGLLNPPDRVPLGANPDSAAVRGGAITCGRVDADNRDDVAVLNRATQDVVLLRTAP